MGLTSLDKLKNFLGNLPTDPSIDDYRELLDPLLEFNTPIHSHSQFVYVIDFSKLKFLPLTSNFEDFTGYPASWFTLDFIYSVIHEDDKEHVIRCTLRLWDIIINHLKDYKPLKYWYNFDYRINKADKSTIRILRQNTALKLDKRGNIHYGLGLMTDITHLKNDPVIEFYVTGPKGKRLKQFDERIMTGVSVLTSREREILQQMTYGLDSKKIADTLCISLHTVYTHRRNMLRKFGLKSSAEMILKAYRTGIVN